jgi:uncharacterized protein (TIGR00369 family)
MSEPGETTDRERVERFQKRFAEAIPHNAALGLQMERFEADRVVARLPWKDHLVGHPELRILHGGAISASMDAICGAAVFAILKQAMRIATLDLRIDYLRPARPEQDVVCEASCYRVTKKVAFTRGLAHQGDPDDAVAAVAGTFMLFRDQGGDLGARLRQAEDAR